ncbi:MAG: copper amine oxidase N-terminal domain-containing protein, partial [Anaerovoracaceae bacterium]|nr:copper amine oxidase N-terminal domain-containing protein [Anaerovoracaceae bacterium]
VQTNKDKYNWIQVTLKETVKDSLQSGRFIDFDLPEEVQVVKAAGIRATLDKDAKLKDAADFSELKDNGDDALIDFDDDKDLSNFSVTVPEDGATVADGEIWNANKANTLTLFIPVTIQADYTGDVKVDIKGAKAGIDDTTLTVAKAVPVVTVEAKTTDVKNGVQKQAVSDIKITENVIGYMNAGTTLTVALDNLGLTNALVFDDAKVEVTAGDLEINKITIKKGVINIPIKEESTKPSTISITGITATLNRTLPEGGYDLKIGEAIEKGNSALIDNEKYNDEDFDVAPVTVKGYINIVTPADTNTVKVNASFVIGKTSYTNNGTEVTMDAAPYIAKNRTMVPIRYIANACGVTDENITWNQATRTATISGPNNVVTIKMGSNTITTSNGVITMDTVAVNTGNRIYVPARFIANALGATVTWDAATQTVGITK